MFACGRNFGTRQIKLETRLLNLSPTLHPTLIFNFQLPLRPMGFCWFLPRSDPLTHVDQLSLNFPFEHRRPHQCGRSACAVLPARTFVLAATPGEARSSSKITNAPRPDQKYRTTNVRHYPYVLYEAKFLVRGQIPTISGRITYVYVW